MRRTEVVIYGPRFLPWPQHKNWIENSVFILQLHTYESQYFMKWKHVDKTFNCMIKLND